LWFAHALVYHVREGDERRRMAEYIRDTVRPSERAEVQAMGKTIAEELIEEGKEQGALESKRETLLLQLRKKFKRVPASVEEEVNGTRDIQQLDTWLGEFATAKKLTDIHFASPTN
jgi:hypothetical protein